jgi:hypothetical protein
MSKVSEKEIAEIVATVKADLIAAVTTEIDKLSQGYVVRAFSADEMKKVFLGVLDPKPVEKFAPPTFKMPYIPPEYPKLKVLYSAPDYTAKEWLIVNNATEETLYRAGGWLTRPLSEVESLKANGVQERPLSEHDRRRDKFKYANP